MPSARSPSGPPLAFLSVVLLRQGPGEEEAGRVLIEIPLILSLNFNRLNKKRRPVREGVLLVKLGDQLVFPGGWG